MDIIKLTSRPRNGTGKSHTRKIRVQGWVPAVYYGHDREAMNIEINAKEFIALVRHRKLMHLINLGLGGSEKDSIAVIREVQRHVVKKDHFIHIDFQHVNMNEKVTVECPVELVGLPIGVKENGGVLGNPIKRVSIECMPEDIPEKITVDVSALDIGDSIHVRDVAIANITLKDSPDEVLAVVTHPTREIVEEVKPEEGAAEGAAAVPAATAATPAAAAAPAAPAAGAKATKPAKPAK